MCRVLIVQKDGTKAIYEGYTDDDAINKFLENHTYYDLFYSVIYPL